MSRIRTLDDSANPDKVMDECELDGTECRACCKKGRREGELICFAMTKFYFQYDRPSPRCFAFSPDLEEWIKFLKAQRRSLRDRAVIQSYKEAIKKAEKQLSEERYEGLERFYYEEVHKALLKAGGGEKADRCNKTFGPERMKDNIYTCPTNKCFDCSDEGGSNWWAKKGDIRYGKS